MQTKTNGTRCPTIKTEQRPVVNLTCAFLEVTHACSNDIGNMICHKTKSPFGTAMLLNWDHCPYDLLIFSISVLGSCSLITISTFSLAFAWTNKIEFVFYF